MNKSLAPSHALLRVALYARVSTLAGQDPEMQLRELREYCQRRALVIVDEYVDKGVSGSLAIKSSYLLAQVAAERSLSQSKDSGLAPRV